jgi:protein-S-isoprenylcysteine O-methyltransferase Ste14
MQSGLGPIVFQADLTEVFAAYKVLRINHQIQYANYKLRAEGNLWSGSPKKQGESLSQAAFVCVLALFAIHLLIAVALVVPMFETFHAFVHNPWVHVVAIWCAIFALAIRTVEEGFGVRDETERYRDYRSSVEAIRERFDQEIDPAEKLRIMAEMERLSYEEMCSFLRNAHATRFVM